MTSIAIDDKSLHWKIGFLEQSNYKIEVKTKQVQIFQKISLKKRDDNFQGIKDISCKALFPLKCMAKDTLLAAIEYLRGHMIMPTIILSQSSFSKLKVVSRNMDTEQQCHTLITMSCLGLNGQRKKIPYLRSKIWNRDHHKNKASNNVV
jgi:hypothetical protein